MLHKRDFNKRNIRHISFLLVCLLCFTNNVLAITNISKTTSDISELYRDSINSSTPGKLVILFTNDVHSSVDSVSKNYQREIMIHNNRVNIAGGFARLATVIERERARYKEEGTAVIVVDAGDMAMGTIFQSIYKTEAPELSLFSQMGYDAFCLGNHDFDYGSNGAASMLLAAKERAGENLPQLLSANILPKSGTELENSFNKVGAKKGILLEKDGVKIGLTGTVSRRAYELIDNNSSINFIDPEDILQSQVDSLKNLGAEYIILLSHGGTIGKDGNYYLSPDGLVADKIKGIDAIVSGHDHDFLFEPLQVEETVIASSGSNLNYIGKMVFEAGVLESYELLPIDANIAVDSVIQKSIDSVKLLLNSNFYEMFGLNATDTIGILNEPLDMVLESTGNMKLGSLIAESYAKELTNLGVDGVIGISMYGTIRGRLEKGIVTVNDVFNLLSLGEGVNGTPGSPLVLAWIKGKELKGLCEVVATISKYMIDATISFSGVEFEYNPSRIPFTKVTDVRIFGEEMVKDKLYPIAVGQYTANLISLVKSESMGLISVTLRDENGEPLENTDDAIIPGATPEWLAFSKFVKSNIVGVDNIKFTRSSVALDSKSIYLFYSCIVISIIALIIFIKRKKSN